ncbi:PTS mannose/fructose/sorbose/N-acetylgalactosamine transporter subunit IIC [Olsenella profusa]|uniref:PTS sugar transporter subunit IIC n=1 Tax=Olsenella profusa TaxID=138595 RepID=A0ABS2F232_9ACTN|nr:PTS sugar transporter subunit IIC [Olsenella profusa]MBM6775044.1 PTS sugar transporter subunit IIC [Olsenella profusa]
MVINMFQAALLGLFACLASMPGMGGTSIGNYTLGRPLVAGLVVGIILGDVTDGILVGMAIQVVYIALVTPGGTVSADVRAACYIGIPLALIAVKAQGLDAGSTEAAALATSLGATCGTLGAILFYGTATINLAWQAMGWKWLEKGDTHKLYLVDMVLPWISHIICSFLPTFLLVYFGGDAVNNLLASLPMDGVPMKTLFAVGSLLPCVGIAILLKQVITKATDFLPFFFGFTLAAVMGCNLIAASAIACFFALINYEITSLRLKLDKVSAAGPALSAASDDDEEEDI